MNCVVCKLHSYIVYINAVTLKGCRLYTIIISIVLVCVLFCSTIPTYFFNFNYCILLISVGCNGYV